MSEPRSLRCYQYVNRPYEKVTELFQTRIGAIFQAATNSAATRGEALVASLRARTAGIDVGVEVQINVEGIRHEEFVAGLSPVTRIALSWQARRAAALFPKMRAELSLWPITSSETQLEIEGWYVLPLGLIGNAADAAFGHRIAEATVHRFLDDIVAQIQAELPDTVTSVRAAV